MTKWRSLPGFERRRESRTPEEHALSRRLHWATGLFWAICGGLVVLYLFFALLGAFDPKEAVGLTAAAAVLTILWLSHAALVLYRAGPGAPGSLEESHKDRERRGF